MEEGDNYSFDLISSVEELMGRIVVASERRLCECAQPDRAILCLGLPTPSCATNANLKQLLPAYTEILSDIRENSEQSMFLRPLFEAKSNASSPDAAVLLLYFLEFPNLVRTVRGDVTGIADCRVQEKFELVDIVDEITTNKVLLQWCREAVADFGNHHCSVLASAISFLTAVDATRTILKSRVKKLIRQCIFRNMSDTVGFSELRSDLARLVVARTDLPYQAVVNSIIMQIHVLHAVYGEDESFNIMEKAPNKNDFALTRVKPNLKENEYQMFRTMLGVSQSVQELLQAQSVPHGGKAGETVRCDKKGCKKAGSLRCTGCRLANYCSKECQVFHWKNGHAKECLGSKKKKSTNNKESLSEIQIQAAAARARREKSPALVDQDRLLSEHGEAVDYVIVLPTGKNDVGVCFTHTMGKLTFRLAREKANGGSLFAVSRMYDMLSGTHPNLKDVIRAQLQAEYGVDPLEKQI